MVGGCTTFHSSRKHGGEKFAWDKVTADLTNHGAFKNNDPDLTLLIVRNVKAHVSMNKKKLSGINS